MKQNQNKKGAVILPVRSTRTENEWSVSGSQAAPMGPDSHPPSPRRRPFAGGDRRPFAGGDRRPFAGGDRRPFAGVVSG